MTMIGFEHGASGDDSVFDDIDRDVIAVRDRALVRAAGMLESIDLELTRLRVLEDCALTLKSANDCALTMLRKAIELHSDRRGATIDEGG